MSLLLPARLLAGNEQWDDRFFLAGLDGTVHAIAVDGNRVYLGGEFTVAGPVLASNVVSWDGTNWSALGSGVDGAVKCLAVQGNILYAGGRFLRAGDTNASRIARWDGVRWSVLGSGIVGPSDASVSVNALAVSGTNLYVGGCFDWAGEVAAQNIARWDGAQWWPLGDGLGGCDESPCTEGVLALVANTDTLYAGGVFTDAGGLPVYSIAQWDGTAWSALDEGMDCWDFPTRVTSLALSGDILYAGGWFDWAGSAYAANVAMWDGTEWWELDTGIAQYFGDLPVTALAVSGDDLFVAGHFVEVGQTNAINLTRWDGTNWWPVGSGVQGEIEVLAVSAGQLWVGGCFAPTDETALRAIAQWDGTRWSEPGAAIGAGILGPRSCGMFSCSGDTVMALAETSNGIYAAGAFTSAGGLATDNIACWTGAGWARLDGGVNGTVYALAARGDTLFAGGRFTAAGPVAVSNFAAWDGTNWFALGDINGPVYALADNGNQLYVGGSFTSVAGVHATNLACWNGANWTAVSTDVNGPIYALAVNGNTLYAGGKFTAAGGVSATNVARWNGTTWSALGSGVSGVVYPTVRFRPPPVSALVLVGNDLYVGGDFTTAGGARATNIARWDGAQWMALGAGFLGPSSLAPPPAVATLTTVAGELYAGGAFLWSGDQPLGHLAKWDGTAWTALGDGIGLGADASSYVQALLSSSRRNVAQTSGACAGPGLYVGGHFKFAGGKPASDFTLCNLPASQDIRLQITRAGDAINLSWPAAADGWVLQFTENLAAPSWTQVRSASVIRGDQQTVTDNPLHPTCFYRLLKQ